MIKKHNYVLFCLAISVGMFSSGVLMADVPSFLDLEVKPSKDSFPINEPMAVEFRLKNIGTDKIYVTVPRPIYGPFVLETGKGVQPRESQIRTAEIIGSVRPVELAAGQTKVLIFYVNRYFHFSEPTIISLNYQYQVTTWKINNEGLPTDRTPAKYTGIVTIKILDSADTSKIRQALESLSQDLDSKDSVVAQNSAEGICSLSSKEALPYIEKVLNSGQNRLLAIDALGTIKEPEANKLLLESLKINDADVVYKALQNLAAKNVAIDEAKLRQLLQSPNDQIRFRTVQFLGENKHPKRLELLNLATKDVNPSVARAASDYLSK